MNMFYTAGAAGQHLSLMMGGHREEKRIICAGDDDDLCLQDGIIGTAIYTVYRRVDGSLE